MSAIEVWKQRVAAHRAQSRQARAALGVRVTDHWEVASPLFRANPHRLDDIEVNSLLHEINPSTTVLDVGGGAGRFAFFGMSTHAGTRRSGVVANVRYSST